MFVQTPGVECAVPAEEIRAALTKHMSGDWGSDICDADRKQNNESLKNKGMLMSTWKSKAGTEFWIITDAGWRVSTALLPDEY